jgi:hypothetical protein
MRREVAAEEGGEKGAGVGAPLAAGQVGRVGDQRAGELVDVVGRAELAEEIPLYGPGVEGVQDFIAPVRVIELLQIGTVGIGNHGAVPSLECGAQHFADRSGLAGSGRSDDLEVFGLIERGELDAGEGDAVGVRRRCLSGTVMDAVPVLEPRAALSDFSGLGPGGEEAAAGVAALS